MHDRVDLRDAPQNRATGHGRGHAVSFNTAGGKRRDGVLHPVHGIRLGEHAAGGAEHGGVHVRVPVLKPSGKSRRSAGRALVFGRWPWWRGPNATYWPCHGAPCESRRRFASSH